MRRIAANQVRAAPPCFNEIGSADRSWLALISGLNVHAPGLAMMAKQPGMKMVAANYTEIKYLNQCLLALLYAHAMIDCAAMIVWLKGYL